MLDIELNGDCGAARAGSRVTQHSKGEGRNGATPLNRVRKIDYQNEGGTVTEPLNSDGSAAARVEMLEHQNTQLIGIIDRIMVVFEAVVQ